MAWSIIEIKTKLVLEDKWLYRGLLAIYNRQTEEEKLIETTKENNGIGFSGCDAKFLSAMALTVMKYNKLTEKQLKYTRAKMLKYTGQLTRIANQKEV